MRGRYRSKRRAGGVLTLTEQTCEIVHGTDRTGVTWDDLVAVHYRAVDRRVLVPRHGQPLEIAGSHWRGGKHALAEIDARVPANLVVFPPAVASELRAAPSAATTAALAFAADLEEGTEAVASPAVGTAAPAGGTAAPAASPEDRASRDRAASPSPATLAVDAPSDGAGAGPGAGDEAAPGSGATSSLAGPLAGLPRPALVAAIVVALLLVVVLIALLAG